MEAKTKYWVACGNCGAPQMQIPDDPAPANSLECELCGHLQPKPSKPREVQRILSEALPADKDPAILMQNLTKAATAFMKAGGALIGFASIEGIGGCYHGGEYRRVVEAVKEAIFRDGLMLGVLQDAIEAARFRGSVFKSGDNFIVKGASPAEAADNFINYMNDQKIVRERDTFNPNACACCGGVDGLHTLDCDAQAWKKENDDINDQIYRLRVKLAKKGKSSRVRAAYEECGATTVHSQAMEALPLEKRKELLTKLININ